MVRQQLPSNGTVHLESVKSADDAQLDSIADQVEGDPCRQLKTHGHTGQRRAILSDK